MLSSLFCGWLSYLWGRPVSSFAHRRLLKSEYNVSWNKTRPKPFRRHKKESKKTLVDKELVARRVNELRDRITGAESAMKGMLEDNGISFIFQHPVIFKYTFYVADFFIPSKNVIIEIDGGYHDGGRQKIKDECRRAKIETRKYSVLRVRNVDIFNAPNLVINRILNFLSEPESEKMLNTS